MKIKKTYAFAFGAAIGVSLISATLIFLVAVFLMNIEVRYDFFLLFFAVVFVVSLIIIKYLIERFIYNRVKKIFDEISLLDSSDFNKTTLTTDMDSLSNQMRKFAEDKQEQISNLIMQESYRREFLGNVSHELKTPLFTVQGYLLTLADGAIKDKSIRSKYLNRANKGVDRLIAIVKDLDLISKLETNEFDLNKKQFDIIALVREVFELLEIKAKRKKIVLRFDKSYSESIKVVADEERIEQVLINLIVNSIKYGKRWGKTEVKVSPLNNDKIKVSITDDGIGVAKEHHSRLFERFYRVDKSRSREQGGSGLGLSIVKHIIESHNEQLYFESEEGKGATFSFTLEKFRQG